MDVSNVPTAVPNLVEGGSYYLQNQGVDTIVAEQFAAAPADAGGRIFRSLEGDYFKLEAGKLMYVWTRQKGTGLVYVAGAS